MKNKMIIKNGNIFYTESEQKIPITEVTNVQSSTWLLGYVQKNSHHNHRIWLHWEINLLFTLYQHFVVYEERISECTIQSL